MNDTLSSISGVEVGHWSDPVGATGCTVILTKKGASASVDVRGAAPGGREQALLMYGRLVKQVHGVLLTGGSVFGLAAADGVVNWLETQNVGVDTGVAYVPIVPAAVLFDLGVGDAGRRPDVDAGWEACLAAGKQPVTEGSVGAGTGAAVGKVRGLDHAVKGGVGSAATDLPGGGRIGVIVAVNAFGDICDPSNGTIFAGARDARGFADTERILREGGFRHAFTGGHTTLAVIATDAAFEKAELQILATMAQTGIARSIRPVHTLVDGDTVFALSTGDKSADLMAAGTVAADLLSESILRAVRKATALGGVPAWRDLADGA